MGIYDDWDDDEELGRPLPPEDRIWRHPSEVGALAGVPSPSSEPRRSWGMAVAGATAGALAVSALWFTLGTAQVVPRTVTEKVAVTPVASTPPRFVDAEDWPAEVALGTWASIVRIDIGDEQVTGIALRDDGTVVTTASSVPLDELDEDGVIVARLHDGAHLPMTVVGVDEVIDLAVFSVEDLDTEPAVVARTAVEPGDQVAIVASLDDDAFAGRAEVVDIAPAVSTDHGVMHETFGLDDTDIPEGAAVLDPSGSVVGITTATDHDGATLAVRIDNVRQATHDLLEQGWVEHTVWLGIDVETAASGFGLPGAAHVTGVVEGSPASRMELKEGDLVTELNGRPVATAQAMEEMLAHMEPGDRTTIAYYRDGDQHEAGTQLGARP